MLGFKLNHVSKRAPNRSFLYLSSIPGTCSKPGDICTLLTFYCVLLWFDAVWFQPQPPWWRHQMETFSALLAICAGNSPVSGDFPAQRPVTRSFDVFFDLRLNKRLSKQWWGWWFETPSCSLWRHCNVRSNFIIDCLSTSAKLQRCRRQKLHRCKYNLYVS